MDYTLDKKTHNKSFIRAWRDLQDIGACDSSDFMLRNYIKKIPGGFVPEDYDKREDTSKGVFQFETPLRFDLRDEIRINPYFFFRNILRYPNIATDAHSSYVDLGPEFLRYQLTERTLPMLYTYEKGANMYIDIPQTSYDDGSIFPVVQTLAGIILYELYKINCGAYETRRKKNIMIMVLNKDEKGYHSECWNKCGVEDIVNMICKMAEYTQIKAYTDDAEWVGDDSYNRIKSSFIYLNDIPEISDMRNVLYDVDLFITICEDDLVYDTLDWMSWLSENRPDAQHINVNISGCPVLSPQYSEYSSGGYFKRAGSSVNQSVAQKYNAALSRLLTGYYRLDDIGKSIDKSKYYCF